MVPAVVPTPAADDAAANTACRRCSTTAAAPADYRSCSEAESTRCAPTPLACMWRAMRWRHQAKPSLACACQSYRGLPHSWPVALNASGGTPLQQWHKLGRGEGVLSTASAKKETGGCPTCHSSLQQPAATSSALRHPAASAAPDQGRRAIWLQLKQVAVRPHVRGLAAHVDGHVSHQAHAFAVGVRLSAWGRGAVGRVCVRA